MLALVSCGEDPPAAPQYEDSESGSPFDGFTTGNQNNNDESSSSDDGSGSGGGMGTTSSNPDDLPGCGVVQVLVDSPPPPTVLLLIDQSGSMDEALDPAEAPPDQSTDTCALDDILCRWDAVYQTLVGSDDQQNGLIPQLESSIRFGLALYTGDPNIPNGCPLLQSVEPQLNNAANITSVYDSQAPLGDTPTGESLSAAAATLDALDVQGDKLIILATDGLPDSCAVPNPAPGSDDAIEAQQLSLDAAYDSFQLGIEVHVISVAPTADIDSTHLQQLANRGQGILDDEQDEQATFYRALDPEALISAFEAITSDLISCEFSIVDGKVDPARACEGEVALDGTPLTCGTQWEVTDPTTLLLKGDACDAIQSGGAHDVAAEWPCEVIVVG